MYIAILMTCGLIVLGFINRRSTVLYICQAIWLWILTGFNSGGVDYATNESIFLRSTNKFSIGEGLSFVYTFLKKMGCNYAAYIAVTTLIAYIIIFAFIYLNAENKCLVASLMYLYPGIDFVIQKRYFLCIPILLIAIQYLNREGKKNKLIYVILVLLATLFHTSAILYFIPIMFFLIPERFRNRIIVLLGVIGLLFAKYAYHSTNIYTITDGIIILLFCTLIAISNIKIITKYIFVLDTNLSKTFLFVLCITTLLLFFDFIFCKV